MSNKLHLPLELADVSPGAGAVKINKPRFDGLTDGVHTGGAWMYRDRVWKATDCRPFMNCDHRVLTDEVEVLSLMANQPMFPKNWATFEQNGRGWIVRNFAMVQGQSSFEPKESDLDKIRAGLVALNKAGWQIGDMPVVGRVHRSELFFVDLSNAHYVGEAANDEWRFDDYVANTFPLVSERSRKAGEAKIDWMVKSIKHADPETEQMIFDTIDNEDSPASVRRGFKWVYGSFNRPIHKTWAHHLPERVIIWQSDGLTESTPYTWIMVEEPLSKDQIDHYELILCKQPYWS